MKTKHSHLMPENLKIFLILPFIILAVLVFSSCSAGKKATSTKTADAPMPPPPPPPPPVPQQPSQRPVSGQKVDDAYIVVDEMPEFPGGDAALLRFIAENTRYPKEAKDQNIQGRVITRFKVNADGTVSDASVIKGVNTYLDAEALKVVSSIPKLTPGKLNGVAVPVWYMVPITFTLSGDASQRKSRFEVTGTDTVYLYSNNMPMYTGGNKALYLYTNSMPAYTGGNEALKKFKEENVKFPPEIKSLGIEGFVNVKFIVEKDGSLSNIKVIMGVSPTLDAEAIRVTKMMPPWQPGLEKGKPVRFQYMTNYEFLTTPRAPIVMEEGTPFVVVEEMPMFPGGDSALLAWIKNNTKYPESAKAKGIEGRVIIRFCVTDVGGIDRVSVLKGVDADLDAEAIRVVKSLPTFKPGKQGGKPVNVWYMVPITFGLDKPADPSSPKAPPPPATALPAGYDEPPVFTGGETEIYKFINSKLAYPKAAKENLISGKVILRFSIDIDGKVGGVSVLKGINPELDAEAIRVIQLLPAWRPAKLEGKPVKVWYTMPVIYTLK
jgi:TonB family protein